MINIQYGRAGTGKTIRIMREIKQRCDLGETGILLIVPEQYSHYAERQLCRIVGDTMSLHAEVLTFTRLCGYVFEQVGGASVNILDKSGQILVMHRAMESVLPALKVFGVRKMQTEMLESMLTAVNEFKSMCIGAERLEEMAEVTDSPLSDKLRDFAIIMSAYNALTAGFGADAGERLSLLALKLSEMSDSELFRDRHIYFDGFNDFTAQEMLIIERLVGCGAQITVCITCEPDKDAAGADYEDIFEIPRRTIAQLCSIKNAQVKMVPQEAAATSAPPQATEPEHASRAPELVFLEKHLFDDVPVKYPRNLHPHETVEIFEAHSLFDECRYAPKLY